MNFEEIYMCNDCGNVFYGHEVVRVVEDYGMEHLDCPFCGSCDFEEVYSCSLCDGVYTLSSSATRMYCPECERAIVGEYRDGLKLKAFLDEVDEKEAVNLNAFLKFCFSPSEIENILFGELMKAPKELLDKWASEFIDNDVGWMLESIVKGKGVK